MDKVIRAVVLWLGLCGAAHAQLLSQMGQATLPLTGQELVYVIQNGQPRQVLSGNLPSGSACSVVLGCTYTAPVTFNGSVTGLTVANRAVLNGGGTLSGTFSGTKTFSGPTTLTNQATGATLTFSGSNTTFSNTNLCGWLCGTSFILGGASGGNSWSVLGLTANDTVLNTATTVPNVYNFVDNVAPNGGTATGNRIVMNAFLNIVGTHQGGTYTNTGIDQAFNSAIWVQSNEGGTASLYQGAHTTNGWYCSEKSGGTFLTGCAVFEADLDGETGSSYLRNTQGLFVHLTANAVGGILGPDLGMQWSDGTGITGYKCIMCLGNQGQSGFPSNAAGSVIYADASLGGTSSIGNIIDASQAQIAGCYHREPFVMECSVLANGITSATRLTTDGQAASSYVYQALFTNRGTGYTSQPAVTVTGCTNSTVAASVGAGAVLGFLGVSAPGTACAAEATMSISGGGGASGAGKLVIAGNTLNFPINSTINVACTIAATSFAHSGADAIGWHIQFGATMGATASTAAIVGSPSWTQDYATASAAGHIGISAPSADTTLGAINLTITPSSGTWDVGGSCKVTKSAQT